MAAKWIRGVNGSRVMDQFGVVIFDEFTGTVDECVVARNQ
jgi:hypothetical protein